MTDSSIHRNFPFRRFGQELGVIIAGVLIALAVNAEYQSHSDKREVGSLLALISTEIDMNAARLDTAIAHEDSYVLSRRELLRILDGEIAPPERDSLNVIITRVFSFYHFQPVTSAYQTAMSSRVASLVPAEFRVKLGVFAQDATRPVDEQFLVEQSFIALNAAVSKYGSMKSLLASDEAKRRGIIHQVEYNYKGLLKDAEVSKDVTLSLIAEQNYLLLYNDLRSQLRVLSKEIKKINKG